MSKSIFILGFALVLLGFLVSITLNMHGDIEMLQAENKTMAENLNQLSFTYKIITQERDNLKNQNTELLKKIEILQQAYASENQARLKAEANVARLVSTLDSMMKVNQVATLSMNAQSNPEYTQSKRVSLSSFFPVSAGLVALLATVRLSAIAANHYRMRKNRNKKITPARNFPHSIPRINPSNM